jgi:putative ABC transport system permease protein
MTQIARRLSEKYSQASRVTDVEVVPLREQLVGAHRLALFALFGAVVCVLVIGCANVANLLLSRGVTRRREFLTRIAVGASPLRIARQLVAESLLLTGSGALAGWLLAAWFFQPLARTAMQSVPLIEESNTDLVVLGFALLLALVSGVVCGVAPLLGVRKVDWRSRAPTDNAASRRLRKGLVIGEIALAVALVSGAGLLLRTVANLQAVDVGFRMNGILLVSTDLTTGPLRERGGASRYLEELMPRLSALPGVRRAGAATRMPLDGSGLQPQPISAEGRPILPMADSPQALATAVTPSYFDIMGVSLLRGRLFTGADTADTRLVSVVNETAARRIWPGEDAIGMRFVIGSAERLGSFRRPPRPGEVEWREVVGVVSDIHSTAFDAPVEPEIYYSYEQYPIYDPKVMVQTEGDPLALAPAVRATMRALNDRAVVSGVSTMERVAAESIAEPRLRALLVGLFSAVALALAALGIYSVMAYTVAQRTQEIGIRKALGARDAQVSRMILGASLRLAAAGILVGLAAAVVAAHWISSLFFGVAPGDPRTIAATCLLLSLVALLAGYVPARRALRVDPAVALRSE